MSNKKIAFGIFIFIIVVIVGFVQVNVINTKALSPIGNTEDNYEMVSEEFGEDFEEFIKDGSAIKIYTEEGSVEDTAIRVFDKELRIKKENPFVKVILNFSSDVAETFRVVKNKVYEKLDGMNNKKEINNTNIEDNSLRDNKESSNDKNIKNENEHKNEINKTNDNISNEELDKIVDDFIKGRGNNKNE